MDFELSDELVAIQDAMVACLEPFKDRREELVHMVMVEKRFPQEVWDAICSTGLMGCLVSEEYGGNEMGLLAATVAVETLASKGFGNALFILGTMASSCLMRNGSERLKQKYLPDLASGEKKFCFAITEPDAGSNAFRLQTLATRDGDDWRLNGSKVFITGADVADHMLLVCRTTSRAEIEKRGLPKAMGLALFILDMDAPGIDLRPIPTHGIEGMTQFLIHFDDVPIPGENIIGEADMGSLVLFNSLNPERIMAAGTACGLASNVLQRSVAYANERKVFKNKPIGSYQGISHPLAKVAIELEASKLLTYRSAWAYDQNKHAGMVGNYANMAKYTAAEMAIDAVDRAIQTMGGYGFSEEYGVIHYYESVRLLRTAPITAELILNFVAEHHLGLPRSY